MSCGLQSLLKSLVTSCLGSPTLMLRDWMRDWLRDLLGDLLHPALGLILPGLVKLPSMLLRGSLGSQALLVELLKSTCLKAQTSMLRNLLLRLKVLCFLLASSGPRLILLELQEILCFHPSIDPHQAVTILEDTLI